MKADGRKTRAARFVLFEVLMDMTTREAKKWKRARSYLGRKV
jgi:hypothetical protein